MSAENQQSPPSGGPEPPDSARFAPGSQVRVKRGIHDPNFADMPLGGWTGTVLEVDANEQPPLFLVGWSQHTLQEMHPIFRRRCQRDGLAEESMWLSDEDLEPDSGEPVPIEQPTALVTRPLNPNDEEDRIRALFGCTSDDPLPEVNRDNLRRYHAYLAEHLTFPFAALLVKEEQLQPDVFAVMVLGLRPTEEATLDDGLLVRVARGEETADEPLAEIEVPEEDPAYRVLSDYVFWLVNTETAGSELVPAAALPHTRGHVPALPTVAPSLTSILLAGGLLCAATGALVASVVECVGGGRIGVPIAAGVIGLLGMMTGARYGRIFGSINGLRSGARFGAVFGLMFGVVMGTLIGALAVAFVGTILGSIAGSLLGQGLRSMQVRGGWAPWWLVGAWAGGLVLAWYNQPDRFAAVALFGAAAGALLGVLLALVFLLTLAFLFGSRQ